MPKLKTKKSFAKRVKVTKKGKIKRSKAGRRHLMNSKSRKQKRNLRKKVVISNDEISMVKKTLPYM